MAVQKPSTSRGFQPPLGGTMLLRKQATECVRLDGRLDDTRLDPRVHLLLLNLSRIGNLVSSYRIEGIDVTRAGARRAIETGHGDTAAEDDMVRFAKFYQDMHEAAEAPRITVDRICEWHARLFTPATLDSGTPGELKTRPNGVVDPRTHEFVFHATPPEDTEAELEALLEWYERDAWNLPPVLAAGLFFVEFEAIHPFPDGNGRMGRLLNLVALKHFGLRNGFLAPIDEEFYATRAAYYSALASTNQGENYGTWLGYYTSHVRAAYEKAVQKSGLGGLLAGVGRPSTRDLLEWVLGHAGDDWFQRSDYPNPKGLSGAAITNSLAELSAMGILRFEGEKRARVYRLDHDYVRRVLEEQSDAQGV